MFGAEFVDPLHLVAQGARDLRLAIWYVLRSTCNLRPITPNPTDTPQMYTHLAINPDSGTSGCVSPKPYFRGSRLQPDRKRRGQEAFLQPDLFVRFVLNRSEWAKGDLNPHVPKDTGT